MSATLPMAAAVDPPPPACLAPVLIGLPEADPLPGPEVIGFKAHNLGRMAGLGLPVPPAFVLPCAWSRQPQALTDGHWQGALRALEQASGLGLGDVRRPLLLSVRSGAPVSMPGMLDTVLNVGLCEATLPGLLRLTGNPRLTWDAYRRLLAGFGETVMGVSAEAFAVDLDTVQRQHGQSEAELDFVALRQLASLHRATIERVAGRPFPQDPARQLAQAIEAVLASWQGERARRWRTLHRLDEAMGTAVTVQRMVFGNGGGASGAGVGFTRHPGTGEPEPWIDFLFNAQGEDVVSGRRDAHGHAELARVAPGVWSALREACTRLETALQDMQDIEFTVEGGQLWLLQTRSGKRTPLATARIALDMAEAGLISPEEARRRTVGLDAETLAVDHLVTDGSEALPAPLAEAACASPGVASGEVALDEARLRERRAVGVEVVLVRPEADTRDSAALADAAGLLTVRGARTAHAAVVARQLGKVCLVGCRGLMIDLDARQLRFGDRVLHEGESITLDGQDGRVYPGALRRQRVIPAELLARLDKLRQAG